MRRGDRLGDDVLELVRQAHDHVTLCAPFAKAGVIRRVLDEVGPPVELELFTRWRPEEVAAGVSDTGVLPMIEERGGRVLLCDRLHAKFVRADGRVLIGSANLTATALGWIPSPNLELLLEVPTETPEVRELVRALERESIRATADIAVDVDKAAALLPRVELVSEVTAEESAPLRRGAWYPALREPRDLYLAYSTGAERLSRASVVAAAADLAALQPPPGLPRATFEALVAARMLQTPAVQSIDAFLSEPRRFGAVRDLLADHLEVDRDAADFAWQTMMRWLLEFLPQRYERRVTKWSEVLVRREAR